MGNINHKDVDDFIKIKRKGEKNAKIYILFIDKNIFW